MENVRRYKDIRIISTEKFASKYTARCQYKSYTIIDEDLVCVELQRSKVVLCKPVSAGMVGGTDYDLNFTMSVTISIGFIYTFIGICDILLIFQTILELSKLHMAKFHYLVMKPSFERAEICFTDTDSFLYHIFGANVRQRLANLAEFFDFSNYPPNHPMYSIENKSKPGRLVQKSTLYTILIFWQNSKLLISSSAFILPSLSDLRMR